MNQNLVERKYAQTGYAAYSISQRGITVLKYFKELREVFPLSETEHSRELISQWRMR